MNQLASLVYTEWLRKKKPTCRSKPCRNQERNWICHRTGISSACLRFHSGQLWGGSLDWSELSKRTANYLIWLASNRAARWHVPNSMLLLLNGCWNECLRSMALTRMSEARRGIERTDCATSSSVISRGPELQFSSSPGSKSWPLCVTQLCICN